MDSYNSYSIYWSILLWWHLLELAFVIIELLIWDISPQANHCSTYCFSPLLFSEFTVIEERPGSHLKNITTGVIFCKNINTTHVPGVNIIIMNGKTISQEQNIVSHKQHLSNKSRLDESWISKSNNVHNREYSYSRASIISRASYMTYRKTWNQNRM